MEKRSRLDFQRQIYSIETGKNLWPEVFHTSVTLEICQANFALIWEQSGLRVGENLGVVKLDIWAGEVD